MISTNVASNSSRGYGSGLSKTVLIPERGGAVITAMRWPSDTASRTSCVIGVVVSRRE
jgi:hypothetical protein